MIEIHEGSGNVYADLDNPNADEMLIKAQLVTKIHEIIKARGWTQQRAAKVLEMPQPKLSLMLRGQFRGISETKMLECLIRLGREVRIVIGPEQASDGLPQSNETKEIKGNSSPTQAGATAQLRVIDNVPDALDFLRSSTKPQWCDAGTQTLGESNVIPLERYREKKILVNFPQATENEQSYAYHG